MKDPTLLSLCEVAEAIHLRRLSALEVTQALLTRIEAWQPMLNAFVRIEKKRVLQAAKDADAELLKFGPKGPLHGVPLAHKDMFYVRGEAAGCGSKLREGWTAPSTSTAIARLGSAGAIRIGALHMSEFAYGPTGHNAYLGPARNPWNPQHIAGGSSSGPGAAVAARLTYAALGSDTDGSIRMPAHCCGVTGLKTTSGRVSRANTMPLSFTLDTVGVIARCAEDCVLIAESIYGPDPLDPTTDNAPVWNTATTQRPARNLIVGVPTSFYVDDLEADVANALDDAIWNLEKLGARVVSVRLPDQAPIGAAALVVVASEAAALHAPWLRTRAHEYTPQVRNRLENGLAYSAIEYLEALRWRGPALAAHLDAIGDVDLILAPASHSAAPRIDETDVGGGPKADGVVVAALKYMRPVNYLGLPAMLVPGRRAACGLPIGVQLIGRPFGDETCVALGRAFQNATDYHLRAPYPP